MKTEILKQRTLLYHSYTVPMGSHIECFLGVCEQSDDSALRPTLLSTPPALFFVVSEPPRSQSPLIQAVSRAPTLLLPFGLISSTATVLYSHHLLKIYISTSPYKTFSLILFKGRLLENLPTHRSHCFCSRFPTLCLFKQLFNCFPDGEKKRFERQTLS